MVGRAQTNSDASYTNWLAVPAPHLQFSDPEPVHSAPSIDEVHLALPKVIAMPSLAVEPVHSSFVLGTDQFDSDFFERELRRGLIAPPAEPRDRLSRGFEAVFKPEEVRIGRRATFSCTIWTAIKRKDPLCLLNPIFLHVSW